MDHEVHDADVDARLSRALRPPELSAGFRRRLRARIDQDSRPLWHGLSDVLHLGGCAVAVLTCAAVIPYDDRSATLGVGVIASLVAYIVLTAMREVLDDA